jgi:hypothetical protein
MTKNKGYADKNLQNVAKDLDQPAFTGLTAQQLQQQTNDRRHQDALNHQGDTGNKFLTDKD